MIKGDRAVAGHGDAEKLLIRLLETLNWYDLLGLFSPEELAQNSLAPRSGEFTPLKKEHGMSDLAKF